MDNPDLKSKVVNLLEEEKTCDFELGNTVLDLYQSMIHKTDKQNRLHKITTFVPQDTC